MAITETTQQIEEQTRLYNAYKETLEMFGNDGNNSGLHTTKDMIINDINLNDRNKHLLLATYHINIAELIPLP